MFQKYCNANWYFKETRKTKCKFGLVSNRSADKIGNEAHLIGKYCLFFIFFPFTSFSVAIQTHIHKPAASPHHLKQKKKKKWAACNKNTLHSQWVTWVNLCFNAVVHMILVMRTVGTEEILSDGQNCFILPTQC